MSAHMNIPRYFPLNTPSTISNVTLNACNPLLISTRRSCEASTRSDVVVVTDEPTFWPRKRLLVERTVNPSVGVPSVVLSAEAALLTSPCFCWARETHEKHQVLLCRSRQHCPKHSVTLGHLRKGVYHNKVEPQFYYHVDIYGVYIPSLHLNQLACITYCIP